jgi:hypothetical protein
VRPPLVRSMPYKFNESRRHKIPKAKYRITNWPQYDAALVRRGSLTVWLTEEAIAAWQAPATGKRGGQPIYSSIAIETTLALRLVFHQPRRQTEGLLRSIAGVLKIDMPIPDHTTLSRRGGGLMILPKRIDHNEPLRLLVDSTGLKIYGEGEWLDQKHGIRSRRRWRKLHLGVDANTHEIVVVELTADGAYDGQVVYDAVAERHPKASVIVPPRITAVASETTTSQRDEHLKTIAECGRMNWQRSSGYNRRSLVGTAMFRYKTIIGRRLHARILAQSTHRVETLVQRAEQDDQPRHAGFRPDPLTSKPRTGSTRAGLFTHQRA